MWNRQGINFYTGSEEGQSLPQLRNCCSYESTFQIFEIYKTWDVLIDNFKTNKGRMKLS